jgi:hypothetical protein
VGLLLAILAYFYFNYALNQEVPTIPIVTITEVTPEGTVVTDQHVIVFGQAHDPDGIVEVQLWVNGEEVASQPIPDQGQSVPINVSQAWIPTGAGNYLFVLRAIDGEGAVGQSDPLTVQAEERLFSYTVAIGDTVEIIAEQLGTTPEDIRERNPGIDDAPPPNTPIYVSPAPPISGGDDPSPPDVPRVDPPAPLPAPGDETPAEVFSPPWWRDLPLDEDFICLINPASCAVLLGGSIRITPPTNVIATLDDACQVVISWQDTTENELGFRLYRTTLGGRMRPELVTLLRDSPGSEGRLSFVDENPPNGRFFYAVTAYDSSGEYWSPPSELITASCRAAGISETRVLTIEALEMTVRDSYDRLYCYVSLAGSPFERVPHGSSFLELESGIWNIAEHFSGSNKRSVNMHRSIPLEIVAECLGWQGGTLVNLGQFSRSHPPEEWDGRLLNAGPDDGSFNVIYRINFADPEETESGLWPIIDTSIPPPYNLEATDYSVRCRMDLSTCRESDEPGISWWFRVIGDDPEPLHFKIYGRRAGEDSPHHYYTQPAGYLVAPQAPIPLEDCDVSVFYSVSSVVGFDPITGEEIESPLSEELEVPPSCPQLEITLLSLHAFSAPDGDPGTDFCLSDCGPTVEAYGWIHVGNRRIGWHSHCDPSPGTGCLTSGPGYSEIPEGSITNWAIEELNSGSGRGTHQNVFRIPIQEDRPLSANFGFYDHDFMSPDDFWCGWSSTRTFYNPVLEARSLEDWLDFDQWVEVLSPNGKCQIALRVRGVP